MKPMSTVTRTIYFVVLSLVFIAMIPIIILYANGYRLGDDFVVVETGGIYVYVPQAGASVYIDDIFRRRTGNFQKETFVQNLEPGDHSISVIRPGYFDWYKNVTVSAQEVTTLYPFLLPESYSLREIKAFQASSPDPRSFLEANPEYAFVIGLFDSEEDVNEEEEEVIEKKEENNIRIWHDEEGIHAEWISREDWVPRYFCQEECQQELIIANPKEDILNLDFYPNRDDVVIYSTKTGVYIAEIDIRPIQLKKKIFSGTDVDMRVFRDRQVFIRDNERLFELEL